jgi:uncharacterized protein involved in exopolysaccharide biosynthesis
MNWRVAELEEARRRLAELRARERDAIARLNAQREKARAQYRTARTAGENKAGLENIRRQEAAAHGCSLRYGERIAGLEGLIEEIEDDGT